jgi:hypothetical protein
MAKSPKTVDADSSVVEEAPAPEPELELSPNTPAAVEVAEVEMLTPASDVVRVFVPQFVALNGPGGYSEFFAGNHEVPREIAEHFWMKLNGVVILE